MRLESAGPGGQEGREGGVFSTPFQKDAKCGSLFRVMTGDRRWGQRLPRSTPIFRTRSRPRFFGKGQAEYEDEYDDEDDSERNPTGSQTRGRCTGDRIGTAVFTLQSNFFQKVRIFKNGRQDPSILSVRP